MAGLWTGQEAWRGVLQNLKAQNKLMSSSTAAAGSRALSVSIVSYLSLACLDPGSVTSRPSVHAAARPRALISEEIQTASCC